MPWMTPAPFTGYYTPPPAPDISTQIYQGYQQDPSAAAAQAEYNKTHPNKGTVVQQVAAPVVKAVEQVAKPVVKTFAEVASTPAGKLAIAYFMPGFGSSIVSNLGLSKVIEDPVIQKIVGNALAEIAINTASGVPLETAIKNASVNAATSAGTPYASQYVDKLVSIPAVSDALVSMRVLLFL